jgi:hypothetical protein
LQDYTNIEKAVSVAAIVVDVTIPGVTAAEARTPTMKSALERGFSKSLGLEDVTTLVAVDGVSFGSATTVRRRLMSLRGESRRLVAQPSLRFEFEADILSRDSTTVSELVSNIETVLGVAGSSGPPTLLAFVKQEAAALGVLTTNLAAVSDMYVVSATKPTMSVVTRTKIIIVQQLVTVAPTSSPTAAPTSTNMTIGDRSMASDGTITIVVVGFLGVIVLAVLGAKVALYLANGHCELQSAFRGPEPKTSKVVPSTIATLQTSLSSRVLGKSIVVVSPSSHGSSKKVPPNRGSNVSPRWLQ